MNQLDASQFYIQMNGIGKVGENGIMRSRRTYHSAYLGLFDFFYSITRHLPHKNTIALLNSQSSHSKILKDLAIKNELVMISKENQSSMAFIEGMNASEVVFLMWTDYHEITGESLFTQDQIREIETVLNKKRIYSLRITNQNYEMSQTEMSYVYDLKAPNIFNYESKAVLISPYKERIPFSIAEMQNVKALSTQEEADSDSQAVTLNDNLQEYDYFKKMMMISDDQKPKDRVVLLMSRVSGSSLKDHLGLDEKSAFATAEIPSWITETWQEWWPEAAKAKVLSGTLVLKSSLFKNSSFQEKLYQGIQKLEKESEWSY